MADIRFLPNPVFQALDDNGNPLSGGKVNVYEAGTSTRITTWTDADQGTANANPVILDSRGEAQIWFDKSAKIVLTDSNDVTVWTIDDVAPLTSETVTGKYNLVDNGSFELDGDGDGIPDNWNTTLNTSTATIAIDTSSVFHGTSSLKFTSAGGGAGTATTANKFSVPDGGDISVLFAVQSNATTATNKVDVIFYDKDGANPSTTNAYTSSGTSPSTFTEKIFSVAVPSGKTQAEVKLTGVSNATTANTFFDNVRVLEQGYLFSGTAGEVTASAADLNAVDGHASDLNTILDNYAKQTTALGGDFSQGDIALVRIGNHVTITTNGNLTYSSSMSSPSSTSGVVPSAYRPSDTLDFAVESELGGVMRVRINSSGTITVEHRDWTGSTNSVNGSSAGFSISYVIYNNV